MSVLPLALWCFVHPQDSRSKNPSLNLQPMGLPNLRVWTSGTWSQNQTFSVYNVNCHRYFVIVTKSWRVQGAWDMRSAMTSIIAIILKVLKKKKRTIYSYCNFSVSWKLFPKGKRIPILESRDLEEIWTGDWGGVKAFSWVHQRSPVGSCSPGDSNASNSPLFQFSSSSAPGLLSVQPLQPSLPLVPGEVTLDQTSSTGSTFDLQEDCNWWI